MNKDFGKRITIAEAGGYFSRYIDIKARSEDKLKVALADDPEALRFYCGRHSQPAWSEDWLYVFSGESFNHLKEIVNDERNQALVIFPGTRNKEAEDSEEESNGRPTLLVFAASTETKDTISTFVIFDDGEEHPGSGGGKGGRFEPGELIPLPTEIPVGSIHSLL